MNEMSKHLLIARTLHATRQIVERLIAMQRTVRKLRLGCVNIAHEFDEWTLNACSVQCSLYNKTAFVVIMAFIPLTKT